MIFLANLKQRLNAKALVLAFGLFVLFLAPLSALDVEFHGEGKTDFGFAFWNRSDILLAKAEFTPKLELFADGFHAFVSLNTAYDVLKPAEFDFSLGEVYAEYGWDFFDFRVGRQLISWGKADGVEITDVICPRDYTKFGADYTESKLPATAIQLRQFGEFFTIEEIWIPVYSPLELKLDKTNPIQSVIFPSEIEIKKLGIKLPTKYNIKEKSVPHGIEDGEWAVRASFYFPAIDFSVSAFRGWDHQANFETKVSVDSLMKPTEVQMDLTPSYNRIWMVGFDMAVPIDMVIIKAETAWLGEREFQNQLTGSVPPLSIPLSKHHQLKALLALEVNPGAGWMINLQYMEDVVFEDTDKLERSQRQPFASFFLSKTLLRETLKLSAGVALSCDQWDTASNLGLSYKVTDDLELSLNGTVYARGKSKDKGPFAKMEKLSNIKLGAKFSF